MNSNDASRILDVIDGRVRDLTRSNALVETTWGTVAAVSADGLTCSAYLYGETDGAYVSEDFRLVNGVIPVVGDSIKVAIDKGRGDRWVDEVYPSTNSFKLGIDVSGGRILTGDGTAAPTFGAADEVLKVNATGDGLEYGTIDSTPAGAVMQYAGSTAPTGWLICDGSAVSRTTYAALFAVIGTTYGAGDGSTTFNLPNAKGKVIVGLDSADADFDTLAEAAGSKTHTHAGHSNHVVTQPDAHAALSHSAHSGTGVSLSAHAGTAVATHSALAGHSHELPFVIDDTYAISSLDIGVFGTGTSRTRDWTSSVTNVSGSYPVAKSQSVSAGTPSAHSVTQPDAHSVTVTDPSAHTDHAAQSHTGTAVDAHSAHDTVSNLQPYLVLHYIIKF